MARLNGTALWRIQMISSLTGCLCRTRTHTSCDGLAMYLPIAVSKKVYSFSLCDVKELNIVKQIELAARLCKVLSLTIMLFPNVKDRLSTKRSYKTTKRGTGSNVYATLNWSLTLQQSIYTGIQLFHVKLWFRHKEPIVSKRQRTKSTISLCNTRLDHKAVFDHFKDFLARGFSCISQA